MQLRIIQWTVMRMMMSHFTLMADRIKPYKWRQKDNIGQETGGIPALTAAG